CIAAALYRRAGGTLLARRPSSAPPRGGGGIPEDPLRRTGPAARGGQRLPAAPQFLHFDAALRARGVLAPLSAQRDGHGAHLRYAHRQYRGAAPPGCRL